MPTMIPDPPEPTKPEIDQLRASAIQKIEAGGPFDPQDVKRIRTDDKWIRRFLMHHDNDQKLSLDMVMATLKWRHENQCNAITKESVPQDFFEKGALFPHNRDKDGCKMLLFQVRKHQKGTLDMNQLKRFFIYWLERLEREEKGEWITVFFDMCDTGMKNMDMEFIQYMINLFQNYYPWILNYIIVFEMPWLLNAMWKIIKSWLPPKSVQKIKFVDRKSISEFVTSDQCLTTWGGTDAYEYSFEPEMMSSSPSSGTVPNGDIGENRKVHFAEGSAPSSPLRGKTVAKRNPSSGGVYVDIDPAEELVFSSCRIGVTSSIFLTNPSANPLAIKIKTTSPEKYRVKPSVGVLEAEGQLEVGVTVGEQLAPSALVRDKFLVMATPAPSTDISSQEVSQLFKTVGKDDLFEARLRVGVAAEDSSSTASASATPTSTMPPELLSKLDQLLLRQTVIEEQLRSARRLAFLLLAILVAVLFYLVMATNNMTSTLLLHSSTLHKAGRTGHGEEL